MLDDKPAAAVPNDLSAYWMPFTANRAFKASPRLFVSARDMHYVTPDGRQVLDATAGLWCVNAGHGRPKIVAAIQEQAATLDYAPSFQLSHPLPFELALRLRDILPAKLEHVFFSNSGSEAVDTALKIALACQRARGEGQRTRLIGRERGYHGVGFGGTSVGGLVNNRRQFGTLLTGVDHLRHTYDPPARFTKGQPEQGAELADDLERLVALHGAETIAAVIVEPVAGSAGVLVPPKGYLERLRAICDRHGILLIFDEVITGFGRLGRATASEFFGIEPDIMVLAKGVTNGSVPMGATAVTAAVHDAVVEGAAAGIELFHGYTYSGHPLACAAALATLETYAEEGLFQRSAQLSGHWEAAVHSLAGEPNVIDVRNIGLMGAVELAPRADGAGLRGPAVFQHCFDNGLLVRASGDTIAMSPPLIVSENQIDEAIEGLRAALRACA